MLWGQRRRVRLPRRSIRPDHVRELFGDRVDPLRLSRHEYVERVDSPAAYRRLWKETFGPADYHDEYLLVVARTRDRGGRGS
jgi:hypothetical protein